MAGRLYILSGALLLGAATSAPAQVFDMGSLTATLSVDHVTQSERSRAEGRPLRRSVTQRLRLSPPRASDAERVLASPALRYQPSASRRQANYARFLANARRVDPAGAATLAADLRSDPLAKATPLLASVGLDIRNVADAYATYWVEAWNAAHQQSTAQASPAQVRAVKIQAAQAVLATPGIAGTSDADKQQFAEALWLQALGLNAARDQAQGNPAQLRAIAAAVRQSAAQMDLDLDSMTLTEEGFVDSGRKSGALEPDKDERRAEGGNGVLIGAALVGLGVGTVWLMRNQRTSA